MDIDTKLHTEKSKQPSSFFRQHAPVDSDERRAYWEGSTECGLHLGKEVKSVRIIKANIPFELWILGETHSIRQRVTIQCFGQSADWPPFAGIGSHG